ncbi:neuropeptides capa receptor-like [Acanthaster planci]|uniref:Neuropeptides capa receptor-like n=1 Tax=Acanthaster planci TaxID=133434 RepID=A0A8B7XJF9_ACAPL|nr:neuropeptides capa receptor-like [Acanthaster planci]
MGSAVPSVFNIPFSHAAPFLAYITIANTGYYSSINLVTIVSLERYLALCHPMKHLRMRGRSRTYKMIAICWLLAFLFAIPISLTMAVFIVMCLQWPEDDTYQEFPSTIVTHAAITPWLYKCVPPLMNLPWIICMLSSIYMYVRILQALNKRGDESSVTRNDPNAAHIRNQVAKMLIVNGTVFFLCQVPYRIITLSAWICWMANIPDPIYAALGTSADLVSQVPQYINGMINPLIYGAINKQYRVAFIEAFRCLTHPGRDNASLPSVSTTVQSPTRTISKNSDTEL